MASVISLYNQVNQLKTLLRTGWLRHLDKKQTEHVADHSFATALLALFVIDEYKLKLNKEKVLTMCLLHDVGETIIGDLTPFEITRKVKHKRETKAIARIFKQYPNYVSIWNEFEDNKTKEAKFVQQIDKLELALQALQYEKQHNANLQEFFDWVEKTVTDKTLVHVLDEVKKIRKLDSKK